jgi:nucleoside-diphosphate-sugar epimerase
MNVMVTGGAGYIGSHAVKRLLAEGHRVVVVDNLCRGHIEAIDALMERRGEKVVGWRSAGPTRARCRRSSRCCASIGSTR